MEDLALHILDIVENSVAAGARHVDIRIHEDRALDLLWIEITDDGKGLTAEELHRVVDPFFTTRTTRRVGLGVPLFRQAALATGGAFEMESSRPGGGTRVKAEFRRSHLDRQPLGDIAGTLLTLIAGRPEVEFSFRHESNGDEVACSTREIKARLGDRMLQSPAGIAEVRRSLEAMRQFAASRAA